jgi:hypothetical protein
MDRSASAAASPGSGADAATGGFDPRPAQGRVAPKASDRPVGHMRVDRYRGRPEIYIESPRLARVIAAVSAVVIVVGAAVWWGEVSVRFDQPDVIRPSWYRHLQLALGLAGIAAAACQVVYAGYFAITGRVWRRWRGVSILFLGLSSFWTILWLVDRFALDLVFG